jgi:peptide deformylase
LIVDVVIEHHTVDMVDFMCLSFVREVPGYVVRHAKITVSYYDMNGEKHKIRLKNYESIVVQHEIHILVLLGQQINSLHLPLNKHLEQNGSKF